MRLVIVSGLSGSGKSVALHMLEDLGYYCVDNIPAGLLPMFIAHTVRSNEPSYQLTAIGVDSLKIEGRYKDAEYVALATAAYRKAVDDAWASRPLSVLNATAFGPK